MWSGYERRADVTIEWIAEEHQALANCCRSSTPLEPMSEDRRNTPAAVRPRRGDRQSTSASLERGHRRRLAGRLHRRARRPFPAQTRGHIRSRGCGGAVDVTIAVHAGRYLRAALDDHIDSHQLDG